MKNLILILITTFTLSCCSKDDNKTPLDQLPQATQTGANTVGCLVNGKVFLPHQEGLLSPVNCYYQFVNGAYYFSMSYGDMRGNDIKEISFFTAKTVLIVGQIYSLNQGYNPNTGGGRILYRLKQ